MKAGDFKNMREVQMVAPDLLREQLNHTNYQYYTIVLRAKLDDYQGGNNMGGDEIKFRYQAVRVAPADFKEDN